MKHTSTAIVLATAALVGPVYAAAEWTYTDLDQDGIVGLTEREFEPVSRQVFSDLDTDGDRTLTETELGAAQPYLPSEADADWEAPVDWEEFHARLYDAYDLNEDQSLAEEEFAGLAEAGVIERGLGAAGAGEETIAGAEITPIPEWRYEELYTAGFTVDELMDEMEVVGPDGEEMGEIEDVIFGEQGEVLAVIAEIGGLLDIGDTHVSVPWDEVEIAGGRIALPITEDNVDEYSVFEADYLRAEEVASEIVPEVDDAPTGPRAWRATELMGDYARLLEDDRFVNYGYVNDLVLKDGELAAVLVTPNAAWGWGPGPYAYPYYGYGYGWRPGAEYYDLPYEREDVAELERFDPERMEQ